jgi:hypothetical protein
MNRLSLIALLALFPFQGAWAGDAPILVELFTSQGCSSCPPAERWLNTRGMELFKRGKIIPLAFHVDYWDYLGWKDPFSSPLFTQRQKRYALAFGADSLYTPQMVVAGRVGFVGSDSTRAKKELADPANRKARTIALRLNGDRLEITLPPMDAKGKVYLAVFEGPQSTQVTWGENAWKTLDENFVVRRLEEVAKIEGNQVLNVTVPVGTDASGPRPQAEASLECAGSYRNRRCGIRSGQLDHGNHRRGVYRF